MLRFLLVITVIFCGQANAQDEEQAVQCLGAYNQKISAICSNPVLMGKANALEAAYLQALASAETVQQWRDAVINIKSRWDVRYLVCGAKLPQYLADCLEWEFSEFSKKLLPAPPSATLSELRQKTLKNYAGISALAKRRLSACGMEQTYTLDDGVSPARDIATAVAISCKENANELSDIVASKFGDLSLFSDFNLSADQRFSMADKISAPEGFIEIVLQVRAARRATSQKRAPGAKNL